MATAPRTYDFGSVLGDVWNTALGSFNKWVDHELGADIALEHEAQLSAAQIQADNSPVVDQTAPGFLQGSVGGFNVTTLALVAGAALVVVLLWRT